MPQKETLVASFSNARTTHAGELTHAELRELCNYLQSQTSPQPSKNGEAEGANRMRRHIIAMAHEMGWKLPNGKADMQRINGWCLQQFGKKALNKYDYKELTKLVSIFKKVYRQFLEKF
jgi:hypothetical protein